MPVSHSPGPHDVSRRWLNRSTLPQGVLRNYGTEYLPEQIPLASLPACKCSQPTVAPGVVRKADFQDR
ncbi:hypothetical protein IG631_22569 [Alternaria alternata]|nr:hypothetical protein IG631_22569 [Alternaria alternata]